MAVQEPYKLLQKVIRIANDASLPLHSRLRSLADLLVLKFNASTATFYLLDPRQRSLTHRISSIRTKDKSPFIIYPGEGIAGECAQTHAVAFREASRLSSMEPRSGAETHVLAIPLVEKGRATAVVTLGLATTSPPAGEDLELLQDILVEAGGLIRSMRVYGTSSRMVRNLTILSDFGRMLNRSHKLETLINLILDACLSEARAAAVFLRLTAESGFLIGVQEKANRSYLRALPALRLLETECSGQAISTGQPLLSRDLIADSDIPPSYVCVPLCFEDRVLGSLTLFGKTVGQRGCVNYDEEDRELVEGMATIMANAFERTDNFLRLAAMSDENEKKLRELSFFYRLSNTMLSTISLNKLVHLVLTALTSGPDAFAERAMLFLVNERSGILQGMLGVTRETANGVVKDKNGWQGFISSGWDISDADMAWQQESEFSRLVRESRFNLLKKTTTLATVVREKRLCHVSKPSRLKRDDREMVERFGLASFASAPLIANDRVVGVVVIDNTASGRVFSEDDLRFLQLFTNQAGLAIEHTMLYNRIEDAKRSLRDAQERLLQGEKLAALGELSATIAHEVKNPLVSIGGFARRLQKKMPDGSDEWQCADMIAREVDRLEKLLGDILVFSRKTTICYTWCNINEIVDEALAVVSVGLDEKGIKVVKRLQRSIALFLGDAQQLEQVFINLFTNALEVMDPPGVLEIRTYSSHIDTQRAVSISVADTGAGISQESLHNIFNPFFTTKESGTGLGLYIAHRIVCNHGGRIAVVNRPESGAEFTVSLPLSS